MDKYTTADGCIQVVHFGSFCIGYFTPTSSYTTRFHDFCNLKKRWMYALSDDCSFVATF